MYCKNCGNQIDDKAVVCIHCGVATGTGTAYCPNCGAAAAPGAVACIKCGCALTMQNVNTANPYAANKSKIVAGILGILLGSLGIHNFYLGNNSRGVLQIVLTVITCGAAGLWGFIEGIMILCGSIKTDANGVPLKD